MAFRGIDTLIEYLKGPTPYDKVSAPKLWEALSILSKGVVDASDLENFNGSVSDFKILSGKNTQKIYIFTDNSTNIVYLAFFYNNKYYRLQAIDF